jgi:hypothetical protein
MARGQKEAAPVVLLGVPFDPSRARREPVSWSAGLLAAMAVTAVVASGLAVEMLGGGQLGAIGRAVAGAAVHTGFLAVGWIVTVGRFPSWGGPVAWSAAVLVLASVTSRFTLWGSLLYLLLPVLLLHTGARHPALRNMGVGLNAGLKPIALGLTAGACLGAHLLISASLTLGYGVRVTDPSQYLAAAAYDLGASGLSAEWLFRGALFSHWWRRWEFWPAASISTALAVGRYLLDPALPATLEARAGAVFYMALLGYGTCALRASSGSLLPGYMATGAFFLAYRMLAR